MPNYVINEKLACKVRDVVKVGLVSGIGQPEPGKMCVEAAVCYAMGLPHNDDPPCVGPEVRELKIQLNDSQYWTSDKARAKGLMKVAIAQLGSKRISQSKFTKKVLLGVIQRMAPTLLRKNKMHKAAKELAAVKTLGEAKKLFKRYLTREDKIFGDDFEGPTALVGVWEAIYNQRLSGNFAMEREDLVYVADQLSVGTGNNRYLNMMADIILDALKPSPGYKYLYLVK